MSSWSGFDEFLAVAQTGSFRQAAQRLGCSASQMSREIAALEDRLGARLFYRTTRQVSLTDAGQRFLAGYRRVIETRDQAVTALLDDADDLQGELRVTCSVAYGERFVVPIINQMMLENPRLAVDIRLSDNILDLVNEGIDLAVRFGKLQDSRLVATRLASRLRMVCASPEYLAKHGEPRTLQELARHECLRGAIDTWTFECEETPYLHRIHSRFRCTSGYGVLDAALQGVGICRLPDFYVSPHLESGELVEVLGEHRGDDGVWAVYPDRKHLPMKVKTLVERLRSGLAAPRPQQCRRPKPNRTVRVVHDRSIALANRA